MRDEFLTDGAGPALTLSARAKRALAWGSAELCTVSVVKRGAVSEIHAVVPDELDALEKRLGEDRDLEHIEVTQGLMEASGGEEWD